EELFESNKIIIRDISGKARLKATFDDKKFYAEHTVSLCVPKHLLPRKIRGGTTFLLKEIEESKKYNLKYILALINSRLINFYFHLLLGGGLHVYPNDVKNLPIHNINFSNPQEKKMHDDLVKLVEKMLDLNKQIQNVSEKSDKWYSLKSEIEKTDNKIDEMVYKLYGITEKEKKIIEGEKSQK
ncbi:MAG: TaqI-like C-terminal specificity domain-containing protein, partial [candidate division WOR-3 bacterium]